VDFMTGKTTCARMGGGEGELESGDGSVQVQCGTLAEEALGLRASDAQALRLSRSHPHVQMNWSMSNSEHRVRGLELLCSRYSHHDRKQEH